METNTQISQALDVELGFKKDEEWHRQVLESRQDVKDLLHTFARARTDKKHNYIADIRSRSTMDADCFDAALHRGIGCGFFETYRGPSKKRQYIEGGYADPDFTPNVIKTCMKLRDGIEVKLIPASAPIIPENQTRILDALTAGFSVTDDSVVDEDEYVAPTPIAKEVLVAGKTPEEPLAVPPRILEKFQAAGIEPVNPVAPVDLVETVDPVIDTDVDVVDPVTPEVISELIPKAIEAIEATPNKKSKKKTAKKPAKKITKSLRSWVTAQAWKLARQMQAENPRASVKEYFGAGLAEAWKQAKA